MTADTTRLTGVGGGGGGGTLCVSVTKKQITK